jgi:lipopolysaccharide transport system ATP-binding protein
VDEVLAVGDAEFQRKCLAKMGDVSRQGRTVVFVSHNMAAVESLCTSGILIDRGRIVVSGSVRVATDAYEERVRTLVGMDLRNRTDRQGDGRVRIVEVAADARTGEESMIQVRYEASEPLPNVEIGLAVHSDRGEPVTLLANSISGDQFPLLPPTGVMECRLPNGNLAPGVYVTNVFCTVNGLIADWVIDAARFEVHEGDFYGTGKLAPQGYGHVLAPHRWTTRADG